MFQVLNKPNMGNSITPGRKKKKLIEQFQAIVKILAEIQKHKMTINLC